MINAIYMALDRNYEKYAIPCLNSIKLNWTHHPVIFLFYSDLSEDFIRFTTKFKKQIKLIKIEEACEFSNLGPVNNSIVYHKYNCWNPKYFSSFDNVLHLDCDTIILKPLDKIFNGESRFFTNNETEEYAKAFKSMSVPMCNAGVFVVNRKHIADKNLNDLYEMTDSLSSDCNFADQSIISMWCKVNDIKIEEDVYFNFQPQFLKYKTGDVDKYEYSKVFLLHYAARKPDTIAFHTWWRVDGWQEFLYKVWEKFK